jgi:mono/diheme cytochrome c family protein
MKKIALGVLSILVVAIVGVFVYVSSVWDTKYDAPYPNIQSVNDSTVIARGKYLATGPAHCIACHTPKEKAQDVEAGVVIPFSGGWEYELAGVVTLRAPNITPDPVTGIGNVPDSVLARSMRHSVNRWGVTMIPIMPFQELSDEDLTAIISYLRSQEPVVNQIDRSEYTFLGKALIAVGIIKAEGPKTTPPMSVTIEASPEYGRYLAHSVADCRGCHTERDMSTGAFIGVDMAGGLYMAPEAHTEGESFMTPNLTPDPETGHIVGWSEDAFIARMKSGRVYKHSSMPWAQYARMDTTDLRAIYRYLMSLEPVNNPISQIHFKAGETPTNQ